MITAILLTSRVQYNKKLHILKNNLEGKRKGNVTFLEGNSAKKKDKNEKFYFAKVEALLFAGLTFTLDKQG